MCGRCTTAEMSIDIVHLSVLFFRIRNGSEKPGSGQLGRKRVGGADDWYGQGLWRLYTFATTISWWSTAIGCMNGWGKRERDHLRLDRNYGRERGGLNMLICIFCTTTGADAYRPVTSIHKDICARLKIELQGFDKR